MHDIILYFSIFALVDYHVAYRQVPKIRNELKFKQESERTQHGYTNIGLLLERKQL